ncbi:MAG: SCO family protein [Candidatus Eisenbacteria bacterium]|nr:SCO family protein [Candidatus Eisenbacteria bacterium]
MRWVIIALLVLTAGALAQDGELTEVGIDEHLGQHVPLDLTFQDEDGRTVRLGDLLDKPTILTLVYYRCPGICTPLLSGVVDVLEKVDLEPGKDYQVLTISFDPTEGPDLAERKKMNFMKAFHEPFPEDAWRFMTGDSAAVAAITDAIGFRYKPQGKDFLHPGVLTVLSDQGKIARYLYGITFLPFDVKMALMEAAEGRTGPTVRRVLLYCFSYDPEGKTYVFNILKVVGTLMMVFAALFVAWLVITTRRARRREA